MLHHTNRVFRNMVSLVLLLATPTLAQAEDVVATVPGTPAPGTQASGSFLLPETNDVEWQWPLYGRVTSQFGYRKHPTTGRRKLHTGIDIAAAPGRTVRAAGEGSVRFAGRNASYGLMVEIDHPDGHRTRYAHLNALWVKKGATVAGGDPIGIVGNTGRSTGPHLHFELRDGRKPVDPAVIAIHFGQPIDALAKQKGPILRAPGLPSSPVARATRGAMERFRGIACMVWDWWAG
ncbi:MAG TPA: M23 family metallopeptidase [Deltaproteobacteria bacterium]|nr:M23 family metallopeptidase [Deltaproteobacteria bacterium]